MGLSCNIHFDRDNKIVGVTAPNGATSILYKDLLDYQQDSNSDVIENLSKKAGEYILRQNGASVVAYDNNVNRGEIDITSIEYSNVDDLNNVIQDLARHSDKSNKEIFVNIQQVRGVDSVNVYNTLIKNGFTPNTEFNSMELSRKPNSSITKPTELEKSKAVDMYSVVYTDAFIEDKGNWEKGDTILDLDVNGEPKSEDVINFLKKVRGSKPFSSIELSDIHNNFGNINISTLSELSSILKSSFTSNGVFAVNRKNLESSNLFTEQEISNILSDSKQIAKLKNISERLEYLSHSDKESDIELMNRNFSFGIDEDFATIELNNFLGLGKNKIDTGVKLEREIEKKLGGISDRVVFDKAVSSLGNEDFVDRYFSDAEFADRMFNKFSKLKPVYNYRENGLGEIVPKRETETAVNLKETLLVGLRSPLFFDNVKFLNMIDSDIWEENIDDVKGLLRGIEENLIQYNIDVIGLSELAGTKTQEDILDFVDDLSDFVQDVEDSSVQDDSIIAISEVIDSFFGRDLSESISFIEKTRNNEKITLFNLDSTKTELELFNERGLIEVSPKIYQKVDKLSSEDLIDTIYEVVVNNPELLDKNAYFGSLQYSYEKLKDLKNADIVKSNLRDFFRKQALTYEGIVNVNQTPLVSEMLAYKLIYGHQVNTREKIDVKDSFNSFETYNRGEYDYDYLTSEYLSDFNKMKLREKFNNTPLYNNVLSNIEVDNRGLRVKYDSMYFRQELKIHSRDNEDMRLLDEYASVSKDNVLKEVFAKEYEFEPTRDFYRNFYSNNPMELPLFRGGYSVVGDILFASDSTNDFIRVSEGVFEKREADNSDYFYTKIDVVSHPYFNVFTHIPSNRIELPKGNDNMTLSNIESNIVDFNKNNNIDSKIDECRG